MKVPLAWLKAYVAVRLSPKALAERLTMAGLEVVGIEAVDGQPILDIEVTPNRADCLSIIGVAREVAAVTGQRLKLPSAQGSRLEARGKTPPAKLTIRIEERKGCQRYIGRLLAGVKVGPSPSWMQERLAACGLRPINNIVDITNYVLLEYGQPLHAFDFARLAGGAILVRRARPQEPITTLDGLRRALTPEMLVIADADRAVAVAGVMGGMGSEVTQETTTVLLESALFDPLTVRRTARALGLVSESSYRFERGVDPVGVEAASARAAALIRELAGGEDVALEDVGAKLAKPAAIPLDVTRLGRWLGARIDPPTVRTTLARLSCQVLSSSQSATMHVRPPSFRRDLVREEDLYEEVARTVGYDRLPATLPTAPLAASGRGGEEDGYRRAHALKRLCAGLGLQEVVTWSLVSETDLTRCGFSARQAIRLANPLSCDHAYLRPGLLIGLLQAVRRNVTQGAEGIRLFELGRVADPATHAETPRLGIALSGVWARSWRGSEPCDFFKLKGVAEALIRRCCDGTLRVVAAEQPWMRRGEGAELRLDGRVIGVAGAVARPVLEALDLEQAVWVAELSVEALLAREHATKTVESPVTFPPVKRDLSVLVGEGAAFEAIDRVIREVAGALAGRVELIDRYTGAQIPTGKVSLTFSIEYQDPARTLTASEADARHRQIGQALIERFGAVLR